MLLDTKLKELRTEVAIMARRAEAMLEKATDLLHAPTEEGVKEVLAMDATLNDLEMTVRPATELIRSHSQ
jgi:Na+/phosphate symporter